MTTFKPPQTFCDAGTARKNQTERIEAHMDLRFHMAGSPYSDMEQWQEVSTLEQLEQFLDIVGGFHDGVLKEVHWVNQDNVDDSFCLLPEQLAHARVLVQRQWRAPSAVEIYFENVWSFNLDTVNFIFDSAASEDSRSELGEPRRVLRLEMERSTVTFERMRWRDASAWMGIEPRFGPFESGAAEKA